MPIIANTYAEMHIGAQSEAEKVEPDGENPMRLLLAGDFSGRAWREKNVPPGNPVLLDRDNFDEVLNGLGLELDLDGARLQFGELEDFHPDRICARLGLPEAAEAAAAAEAPERPALAAGRPLLEQILGDEEDERPAKAEDANDLAAFIRRATAGQTAPRETAAGRAAESERQARAGRLLRSILRHPRFQAMEAAWRAAFLLVRGLDTGSRVEIYLLDITLPELVARADKIEQALARKGGWGCIALNYSFGQSETEARVLARLAGMARVAGGPLVAEARVGEEAPPAWEQLRRSREARWIGLAMPRFLLRLPYGQEASPIESFPFEEMDGSEHGAYVWGNPAFLCAYLVGQSFLMHGWNFGRRLTRRVDGLPRHIYREDGEPVAKPCAEILMTEREAESLLDAGFMPVASLKNEAAVLVVRFQSIAEPAAPLAFGVQL